MTTTRWTFLAAVLVLHYAPAVYGQGPVPVGDQFQINSDTPSSQWSPSLAGLADGGFMAVWTSNGPSGADSSGTSIQCRRFDADGTALGNQLLVNGHTLGDQHSPSVAALQDGGFVAVWESLDPSDGFSTGSIRGRCHDVDGTPMGREFQIGEPTSGNQGVPSVATLVDGNFVVIWIFESVLFGQRFAADGTPLGEVLRVDPNTEGEVFDPSVAALADGGFAVTWYHVLSTADDSLETSVQGQRFAADGTPLGSDFQVNSGPAVRSRPVIAALAGGGFVVVWDSSSSGRLHGQLYSADGTASGEEFLVNAYAIGIQRHPSVATDGDGFVVVWDSVYDIRGQRYAAGGRPLGGEFRINTLPAESQDLPAVASRTDGGFTVAWQRWSAAAVDPPGSSIQGRHYDAPRFTLVGLGGGCLEVEDAADGTPVRVFRCHDGVNQLWRLALTSSPQRIVGLGGKCLVPGPEPDSALIGLVLGECGGPSDLWQLANAGHAQPSALIHLDTGLCLDIYGQLTSPNEPAEATPTILAECEDRASQLWRPAAEVCTRDSLGLCLSQERFRVDLEWRSFDDDVGSAKAVPVGSNDSGLLWFFQADNWEFLVKVLDGCAFNDHFWVFAAATTTVEYTLRVTDTWVGTVREYHNELGTAAAAINDTSAFAACPAPSGAPILADDPTLEPTRSGVEILELGIPAKGSCVPSLTQMCLSDDRFAVEVTWRDYAANAGSAQVVPIGSKDSGLFWFFDSGNWEMLVKVLDACESHGQFLFLGAATTDVEYTVTVTDMDTGAFWQHTNPLGHASDALVHWFETCS